MYRRELYVQVYEGNKVAGNRVQELPDARAYGRWERPRCTTPYKVPAISGRSMYVIVKQSTAALGSVCVGLESGLWLILGPRSEDQLELHTIS